MTTFRQVMVLLGVVLLVVAMPLGFLTAAQVAVAGLLWLAGCALISTDVAEITMGKLAIKRDVRAAREIRKQIEQQAQGIREIRDQVEQTENRVTAQAQSINATSERVAQSEAQVMETRHELQRLGARIYEASMLNHYVRRVDSLSGIPSDHALRVRWVETLEDVRALSELGDTEVMEFLDEVSDMADRITEARHESQQQEG